MWFRLLYGAYKLIRTAQLAGRVSSEKGRLSICNKKARMIANALAGYIVDSVKEDKLKLHKVSPFKRDVLGKSEKPMFDTGELLSHLKVKKVRECAYIVYWDSRRLKYEQKGKYWTASDMIDYHRKDRRMKFSSAVARTKYYRWFWANVDGAGYSPEDMHRPGGMAGRVTQNARPFFDRAVDRFKKKVGRKTGVSIQTNYENDKTVLIQVDK